MKLFSSLIEKIEVIAFIFGFVTSIYMLVFFPAKYFFMWHQLPSPPEPIEKIISADHMGGIIIRTRSNKDFTCDLDQEEECWTEIDYAAMSFGEVLCFVDDCPDEHTVQIVRAIGLMHNFGALSFKYSLRDDGNIYVKHTGIVFPTGFLMGAILGGVCAFIAFLGKYLIFAVLAAFQRIRSGVR